MISWENLHSTGFAFVGDENVGFLDAENVEEVASTPSVPSTPPYEGNIIIFTSLTKDHTSEEGNQLVTCIPFYYQYSCSR